MNNFHLKKNWKQIFDKNGNWVLKGFSPWTRYPNVSEKDYEKFYELLFDEDGNTNLDHTELLELIDEQKWSPFCNAVEYYYSMDIPRCTKYNYTSSHFWR